MRTHGGPLSRLVALPLGLTLSLAGCELSKPPALAPAARSTEQAAKKEQSAGSAATPAAAAPTATGITYTDVPFSAYSAPPAEIATWAKTFDDKSIAAHGWKIWAAITQPSGQTHNGRPVPAWDTWYTEADVFNRDLTLATVTSAPKTARPWHRLRQAGGSSVMSFNKYNLAFRKYVAANSYNKVETLWALNKSLPAQPLEKRVTAIPPLDGVILKPTYWAVKQGAATPVPYWKGPGLTVAGTAQPRKPTDATWEQVVLVNDTGKPVQPEPVKYTVYAQEGPKEITVTPTRVVTPDDFYAIQLTQEDVDYIATPGNIFQFGGVPVKDLKPGDWALLVGMHVTTVEWENWTWQTFWWSPAPEDPFGLGRPGVKAPFTNYDMASAYYTVGKNGKPHIAFNPHLETPINGQIFMNQFDTGHQSNCMSCHRAAAFPTVNGDPNPANFLMGSYIATGTITGKEQFFLDRVQTHNMWGLVLGVQSQPQYGSLINEQASSGKNP